MGKEKQVRTVTTCPQSMKTNFFGKLLLFWWIFFWFVTYPNFWSKIKVGSVFPDSTFSSLNKKEKLKSLKSNIDSQLIPDDPDATVESIINSILYDQKFHKLEDELATTDKISEFGKLSGLNRLFWAYFLSNFRF